MTPEQQRIAIAEACGWTGIIVSYSGALMGFAPFNPEYDEQWQAVPNYPEDLNAMHEAEKVLTPQQTPCYVATLITVCGSAGNRAIGWPYITATAAQRAGAFLRTIGKWKD